MDSNRFITSELQNGLPQTLRSNQNPWPPPVYETARPSRPGRVSYGQWDNYRTNYDDYLDVYLFGIQSDN